MERLTTIVRKTEVTVRWNSDSVLSKIAEKSLFKEFEQYNTGLLVYPDGNGE